MELEAGFEEKSEATGRQDVANIIVEKLEGPQPERKWAPYVEQSKLPQYIVTSEIFFENERAYLA